MTAEGRPQFETSFCTPPIGSLPEDLEYEMVRSDGSLLPVLLSSSIVHAADGAFLEFRATMFDISERREADLKLRASEAAMRQANAELARADAAEG